jgi:cytochrome b561
MAQDPKYDLPTYTPTARGLHWLIALLILIQLPLGFYMSYRGNSMPSVDETGKPVIGVWDALTGYLYSSHKLIGLFVLALVVWRLLYRLTKGAPRSDPTIPPALIGASHLVHWSLYALLLAVPTLGYLATSYGDYLDVFGVRLPMITEKNEDHSKQVFHWHALGAFLIVGFATLHIAAAFYHRFLRRDRVVERMIPKRAV